MPQFVAESRPGSARGPVCCCPSQPFDSISTAEILDRLYRKERAGLVSYLARHAGPERAADLAQEVFLRAATSPQLRFLENPGGFLRKIAFHLIVDEARRKKCRIQTQPLLETIATSTRPAQEDAVLAQDTLDAFERALAHLPEKTARIFAMNRFEEKSYRQIHFELGIALPTVDYHMMKALAHLRNALGCKKLTPLISQARI